MIMYYYQASNYLSEPCRVARHFCQEELRGIYNPSCQSERAYSKHSAFGWAQCLPGCGSLRSWGIKEGSLDPSFWMMRQTVTSRGGFPLSWRWRWPRHKHKAEFLPAHSNPSGWKVKSVTRWSKPHPMQSLWDLQVPSVRGLVKAVQGPLQSTNNRCVQFMRLHHIHLFLKLFLHEFVLHVHLV